MTVIRRGLKISGGAEEARGKHFDRRRRGTFN